MTQKHKKTNLLINLCPQITMKNALERVNLQQSSKLYFPFFFTLFFRSHRTVTIKVDTQKKKSFLMSSPNRKSTQIHKIKLYRRHGGQ